MKETAKAGNQTLSYYRTGTPGGIPVVVMHGWGCTADTVKVLADAAAAAGCDVFNVDLPGFGASPEPESAWTVYDYADCMEQFCHELGLKSPVLVGHSFGGRLAIIMASRTDVSKVILVDAAGIKPRRSPAYYIKVYTFKAAKAVLPVLLGKKLGQKIIDRWRSKAGSSDYRQSTPMMRAIMSKAVNEDLRHLLPSISAPTLLVWGAKDTATPIADARLMQKLIPDAGLVEYEDAGHYSFLDRPAQTAAVIQSFLKS